MPRVLKNHRCRVCNKLYVAKSRKYKRTCSPHCALFLGLLQQYSIGLHSGLTFNDLEWQSWRARRKLKVSNGDMSRWGIS